MERATGIVERAGYAATSRLKTRGTLIDKLRRDPNTKLPNIQDVAGLRVTVAARIEQDATVTEIEAALDGETCSYRTRDRRDEPSFGYRAVHIVAIVDATRVEIQVRTELQDLWAQVAESMGDVYGRQIRYGGEPKPGLSAAETARRRELVNRHRGPVSMEMAGIEAGLANLRLQRMDLERHERLFEELSDGNSRLADLISELDAGAANASLDLREKLDDVRIRHEAVMQQAADAKAIVLGVKSEIQAREVEFANVAAELVDTLRAQIDRIRGGLS